MRGKRFGLVLVTLFTLGWQSIAAAQPALGELTFGARRTARPAVDASFRVAGAARRSVAFRARVGGVAFGEVAQPSGVDIASLSVRYDNDQHDGARLMATINGEVFTVRAPDWILLPAARFAASDQIALVTAFGDYAGRRASAKERQCKYIFSYHPAVHDSLMGLRLFQADLIGMTDQYAELFTDAGTFVLGAGEVAPSDDEHAQWRRSHRDLLTAIAGTYTSYLLTDADTPIVFTLEGADVRLEGGPSYHPWRDGFAGMPWRGGNDFVAAYVEAAQQDGMDGDDIARRAELVATATRSLLESNHERDGAAGVANNRATRRNAAAIDAMLRAARSQLLPLDERIMALAFLEMNHRSVDVRDVTDSPLGDPATTRAANPVVHDAVTRFAQVASFLRYVRVHHPAAWKTFHRQVRRRSAPTMKVPTEMPRGGC